MAYRTVGLIGKASHKATFDSIELLINELLARGCNILVENKIQIDSKFDVESVSMLEIGRRADLAIVVGGDGNMLGAARVLAEFDIDVVGVNRGNLGFLTDISPDDITEQLEHLFTGNIAREKRFLIEALVYSGDTLVDSHNAVNEIVLHHSKVAHMMEFELYIEDRFVFSQRSDGLIIATPTGSTAYSLSGGGPILTPHLDVLTLVPMFPHTLSSRPIVVDANNEMTLKISNNNSDNVQVSCDSHVVISVNPGDHVIIRKNFKHLTLIHPPDYNYFNVLRKKLNWGSKLY
ncbi:NAD(+) kinase [Agaribacter marinus]|uniref:NAD kinase n=1 Tax=Agaribacter marinus TaxID=1431249 RepID=A0AA37T1D0_9ALTE|nr:NAD(+) kinase [Agaribacter marinus]GLR70598.1 NAD kinase [Agaribacter marinus]